MALARIALQVVELGVRRPDVAVARVGERVQGAPAEVVAGVHRLGVDPLLGHLARPFQQWPQRAAAQVLGAGRADEIEDGRHDVDVLHRLGDARARLRLVGHLDDERHVHGVVVEEDAVLFLAVVAEPFTVIRHEEDRRLPVQLLALERVQQPADHLVVVRHLLVVRGEAGERRPLHVRAVHVVQVQEQEEARRALAVEPLLGRRFRVGAVAPDVAHRRARRGRGHVGVEEVEPLADARVGAQHERRHDAAGGEPALVEQAGQRLGVRLQDETEVVADAVLEGELAGQHRGVRRQRLRRLRVGVIEHDAVVREGVDVRGVAVRVAVDRKVIGPQRVDGDEDDRPADRGGGARVAPARRRGDDHTDGDEADDERDTPGAARGRDGRRPRGRPAPGSLGHLASGLEDSASAGRGGQRT